MNPLVHLLPKPAAYVPFPENQWYRDKEITDENGNTKIIREDVEPLAADVRATDKKTLDKMIKSPSTQKYLQESIVTMRDGRFVVPVKTEFKGNVGGLVHGTSATGSTLFIEPISVVEANNDIRILQGKEQDEIHRILTEFSKECALMQPQIESSYDAAVKLDLYFSKANLGAKCVRWIPRYPMTALSC